MDLQKIYTDNDFLNAVVPEGQILLFNGIENGKVVTRYKDSSGNFGTLSGGGGGGGADVTLGQIDANGNFQPLAFNGTEASNSGNPETVENYYGWNGTLPVPDNGIKVGEAAEYYKCASVDTVNKTWTGYKAVLTADGIYNFEEAVTEGLTLGKALTPVPGKVYTADCMISCDYMFTGFPEWSCPVNPTGNTYGNWIMSASSTWDDGRAAYKAFTEESNNSGSDGWHSTDNALPLWIQWQNKSEQHLVRSYRVLFYELMTATAFMLQGSNDGEVWETLDTVDNSNAETEISRQISNDTAFYFHRIYITDSANDNKFVMIYRIIAKSF